MGRPARTYEAAKRQGELMSVLKRAPREMVIAFIEGRGTERLTADIVARQFEECGFTREELRVGFATVPDPSRPRVSVRGESWTTRIHVPLPERQPHEHFTYVIGFGPYIKIGRTQGDLIGRLSAIQNGAPEALHVFGILVGDRFIENDLHARFATLRLNGEWFRREGELAAWIDAGCPL